MCATSSELPSNISTIEREREGGDINYANIIINANAEHILIDLYQPKINNKHSFHIFFIEEFH